MISNIIVIPKAIFQEWVLAFLNIEDLVRFDTAVLNHLLRGQMLELLQGAALHTQPIRINTNSAEWFLKRNIRVSSLQVGKAASELAIVKQLACSADTFIKFSGCNSEALNSFMPLCCNVKSFRFLRCFSDHMHGTVLDSIAKYCLKLESINISNNLRIFACDLENMTSACERMTDINVGYGTVWVNLECMQAIAVNCPQLRRLVLDGCEALRDDSIELLAQHCRELRYLSMNSCYELTDESLLSLTACVELRTLLIFSTPLITTDGIIALSQGCTKLEQIALPQCDGQIDLTVAALVQHCPAFRILRCFSPHLTDASLQALHHCKHFNTLELKCDTKISTNGLLQLLDHCCDLQNLELPFFQFQCQFQLQFQCPPTNAAAVPHLPTACLSLRYLSLSCSTSLTDAVFIELVTKCPNITELKFHGCTGLTEAAVFALANCCKRLENVRISHLAASDSAMCALTKNCPNLYTLCVSGCNLLTDATMSALAQHCPYLRHLDMSHCTLITDAGVDEILQKCRQLRTLKLDGCVQLTNKVLDAILSYGLHMRVVDLSNIDAKAAASFRSAKPNCTLSNFSFA